MLRRSDLMKLDGRAPPQLNWFRANDTTSRPQLIRGGLAVTLGCVLTLFTALTPVLHLQESLRLTLGFIGSAMLLYGLVIGFVVLPRMLFTDQYVAIRKTGLWIALGKGEPDVVPWDTIDRVRADGDVLVIDMKDAPERRISLLFGSKKQIDLAACLDEARRKAAHGLLEE